jgi:hypothetical protein
MLPVCYGNMLTSGIFISMHVGVNKDPVPKNWQTYDRLKYKEVTKAFQSYLATCYCKFIILWFPCRTIMVLTYPSST